ncbi:MAG: 30S ribosomal protein S7 [Candidatus Magasanikbacteria bacterium]
MRREGYYEKKEHDPDYKYDSVKVTRFINYLMRRGKKSLAENIFYNSMDYIEEQLNEDPLEVFEKAISNASPKMEVVSRRIGGANYQIPRKVRPERKFFLAAQWIIEAARSGEGSPIYKRLAEEIISAYNYEGSAINRKESVQKMAEANKAFAGFLN